MRNKLSPDERRILRAALDLAPTNPFDGSVKCDQILRSAIEMRGKVDRAMDLALCGGGDENRAVKRLYDLLRSLVKRGLLKGKGNLRWGQAGPRYTEAAITPLGQFALGQG